MCTTHNSDFYPQYPCSIFWQLESLASLMGDSYFPQIIQKLKSASLIQSILCWRIDIHWNFFNSLSVLSHVLTTYVPVIISVIHLNGSYSYSYSYLVLYNWVETWAVIAYEVWYYHLWGSFNWELHKVNIFPASQSWGSADLQFKSRFNQVNRMWSWWWRIILAHSNNRKESVVVAGWSRRRWKRK